MSPLIPAIIFAIAAASSVVADEEQAAKDKLFLETLSRLDIDINSNERIKTRLNGVLDRNKGTELYVDTVVRYKLTDRSNELLELAIARPTTTVGVKATKAILDFKQRKLFETVIIGKDVKRTQAALTVLGYANDKRAFGLISSIATNRDVVKSVRTTAIQALATTRPGERTILAMAATKTLPDDLNFTAANFLLTSSDPTIREQAKKHLQLPKGLDRKPLPPISELITRTGDAKKGKFVFTKATCVTCHKLDGIGVDYGPDLSDIGNKLPKEALYTSILDPSAGILMGYEGWLITTEEGDEMIGYIIGDTKTHISLKVPGGIMMQVAKSEIETKKQLKQSLMPTNLQLIVTQKELTDLVEYLSHKRVTKKPQ